MKPLTGKQIKKRIGADGSMLVLANVDGTMWASNRYWLTRAEPLKPFLTKYAISDPGAYVIENGTARQAGADAGSIAKILDPDQYTVPLAPVSLGGYERIFIPAPEGACQLFENNEFGGHSRIVAVPASQLEWLEDIALPPEEGRLYEYNLATTERTTGPVAIIADPVAPEPEDESPASAIVAVLMPAIQPRAEKPPAAECRDSEHCDADPGKIHVDH